MNTDIAGNLTQEELNVHAALIKERFQGFVQGYLNRKPCPYELQVFPIHESSMVRLSDESRRSWKDVIPRNQWKLNSRLIKEDPALMYITAFFFPSKMIALILYPERFYRIKRAKTHLKELGYTPVNRQDANDSYTWSTKNKREFLSILRDPELENIDSVDERTHKILSAISSGIQEEIEVLRYGIYIPKRRRRERYSKDPKLNKVKKAVDIPLRWAESSLEQLCKGLPITRAVGLTSLVKTNSGDKHIPMIDFEFECRIERVYATLQELEMPGVVVNSGNSYHFYGFNLLDKTDFDSYMERIKPLPGVDTTWVNLQIEQTYALLRITPSRTKLHQPCILEPYISKPAQGESSIMRSLKAA